MRTCRKKILVSGLLLLFIYHGSIFAHQRKISISVGGMTSFLGVGFLEVWKGMQIPGGPMDLGESFSDDNAFGFNLGLAIFLTKNIEVAWSVNYLSNNLRKEYYISDMTGYMERVYGEKSGESKITELMFCFGLNYYLLSSGKIRPYLGAGIIYINANMNLVKDIRYSIIGRSIRIDEVYQEKTNIPKLGSCLKFGGDLLIGNIVAVFIEGKYILAEKKILHPFSSKHEEFIPPQYVNIDLGGFSLYTGVKFIF